MRKIVLTICLLPLLWACGAIDLEEPIEEKEDGVETFDTCYLWNGHVVVRESLNSMGVELTLISLYEWKDVPSANHISESEKVGMLTEKYQEMELEGWQIPTAEEAKFLKTVFGGESLELLNKTLTKADACELDLGCRYLCEKGMKSFSFANGTSISNAGSKSEKYRLRLVKRVMKP